MARDPPPGHPRDLKFEPGDPSWPLEGPQARISSIFGLILEVWGPSLGSILASLGHLWAPNASKGDPPSPQKWRKSGVRRPVGQNLQKSKLPDSIFKRFWHDFSMILRARMGTESSPRQVCRKSADKYVQEPIRSPHSGPMAPKVLPQIIHKSSKIDANACLIASKTLAPL